MKPYWSASSMVLYVVMGLVSMGAVSYVKKREYKQNKIQKLDVEIDGETISQIGHDLDNLGGYYYLQKS
jgi:predicted histidine transporter YuiF (NhaC family)